MRSLASGCSCFCRGHLVRSAAQRSAPRSRGAWSLAARLMNRAGARQPTPSTGPDASLAPRLRATRTYIRRTCCACTVAVRSRGDVVSTLPHALWIDDRAGVLKCGDDEPPIAGILVRGDLTMDGALLNWEDDFGPFLQVEGNLTTRAMATGGSRVYVGGNHGQLEVGGTLTARVVATEHRVESAGALNAHRYDGLRQAHGQQARRTREGQEPVSRRQGHAHASERAVRSPRRAQPAPSAPPAWQRPAATARVDRRSERARVVRCVRSRLRAPTSRRSSRKALSCVAWTRSFIHKFTSMNGMPVNTL